VLFNIQSVAEAIRFKVKVKVKVKVMFLFYLLVDSIAWVIPAMGKALG
jgi:hypothetical protein